MESQLQFDGLFRRLYPPLFFYARGIVGTDADAEDVVEDVFVELWKRHTEVEWGEQIESYCYRAVFTRSINLLRSAKRSEERLSLLTAINDRRMAFFGEPDGKSAARCRNGRPAPGHPRSLGGAAAQEQEGVLHELCRRHAPSGDCPLFGDLGEDGGGACLLSPAHPAQAVGGNTQLAEIIFLIPLSRSPVSIVISLCFRTSNGH